MNGQQQAILLRMHGHTNRAKWWKRSEFKGTRQMRADLEKLVLDRCLETHEMQQTLGNGLKVTVMLYRLAPKYRDGADIPGLLGA